MNLDSVRDLKQSLAAHLLPKIESTITARAAFGRAAAPIARASEPPPFFALGVAPDGKRGDRLAVRVQKRAFQESRELEMITQQAKGEVDVRYVGRVSKRATPWYQQRQRPLLIGGSIGHVKVTAGTLGCFVKPRTGTGLFVLSNNHVLADENRGKRGDDIIQPGTIDGGNAPEDVVAKLGDFVRLKKISPNAVDCALGELVADIPTDLNKLRGNGRLSGLGDAFLDEGTEVTKIGRTTGLTHGRVTAFELDNVVVGFDIGDQGGANGQGLTYANPLRTVLDMLKVELAL